jgi:multicomponent K+:H+ antiporter subunit E
MKRIRGRLSPVMVLGLAGLWLMLNQSLAPGHVVLGLLLSLALAWFGSTLRPLRSRLHRLDQAALLLLVVLRDIVRSNLGVARIVLGTVRSSQVRSGFLQVPLELRDPHGLAALAAILTSTPGTVWVGLSADGSRLTVHVLDLKDEDEWIRLIKDRYERPLRRIFE